MCGEMETELERENLKKNLKEILEISIVKMKNAFDGVISRLDKLAISQLAGMSIEISQHEMQRNKRMKTNNTRTEYPRIQDQE